MSDCNFTNNYANGNGDNVYWSWAVEEFLNKYGQINDYDYVMIKNGTGTPNSTIVLNKKGVTISSQDDVIFDAKGGNVHFEVTGDNVLIEGITFRNFNFTGPGGAILWNGTHGILRNCNFINNIAQNGGGVYWNGTSGNISTCTFNNNYANSGGGIRWENDNGILIDSTFINNTGINGGGLYWCGENNTLKNSIFINNNVNSSGGGVIWFGNNGYLTSSTFINNNAIYGSAVRWVGNKGILSDSTFTNNTATGGSIYWTGENGTIIQSIFSNNTASYGGAICWNAASTMINCTFNSKFIDNNYNGIYTNKNLIINGGKGIVTIYNEGTLSGISIVVLNNETYYYPPNSNINLTNNESKRRDKIIHQVFNKL